MERQIIHSDGCSSCPIISITKSVIFVLICAFILYLPLEPQKAPFASPFDKSHAAYICICDTYHFILNAADKTVDIADELINSAKDFLYDTKMKFYNFLGRMDRDDLCTVIRCCSEDNMKAPSILSTSGPTRSCRCHRKRICKPSA